MVKAARETRPPGIYQASEQTQSAPLSVSDVGVTGFVGLAQKGPLDEPVRIGGWNEFIDTFGQPNYSYLGRSVEGFFANGGRSCFVVRIAHRAKNGVTPRTEHASCSERVIVDKWEKPTLRVRAINEGRWGNSIWVKFGHAVGRRTLLTMDLEMGAGEARVNSVRGFDRGALVRIYDRENSDFVILTDVGDRTLEWGPETPVMRKYGAAGPTYLEVLEFEVYATLKDRREVFRGLQMSPLSRRYAPRVVSESLLIRLEDLQSPSPFPHNFPQEAEIGKLEGGRDGIDLVMADDFIGYDYGPGDRRGLMSLGAVEAVALLSVPDAMLAYSRSQPQVADQELQRVQDAMVNMCENLKDRFALLDGPPTKDIDALRKWARRVESSYAAVYYPWIVVNSTEGLVSLPPSGHIAGIFARCDEATGVHKAPANEVIEGAQAVSLNLSEDHLGVLNEDGINALRIFPGRGVRVWGARTRADEVDWRYINVRRLFIMLRRALEEGTQWAVFEPNSPETWERLERDVSIFMSGLLQRGCFAGSTQEECFFVKCDRDTNTEEVRELGQMVMEIGVAPAIPTEFIIFSVVQKLNTSADGTTEA